MCEGMNSTWTCATCAHPRTCAVCHACVSSTECAASKTSPAIATHSAGSSRVKPHGRSKGKPAIDLLLREYLAGPGKAGREHK